MIIGIGAFKDYFTYDKTIANYLTNLLLIDSSILEEKLLGMVNNGAVILLHNDYITKNDVHDKITEVGVPNVIVIHEQDLELLNSVKINEKLIDIRTKTTEEGIEEAIGVV